MNDATKSILLAAQMPVHRQTLSFAVSPAQRASLQPSPLEAVIKSTLEQQIHQHVRAPPSLSQTLKARTKKLLCKGAASPLATKFEEQQNNEQRKRGSTTFGRNRPEWRVNQTKKQLQLLNELYRNMHKNKIRYCEEIQHQEAQLHMALAQSNLRKTLNTSAAKPPRLTQVRDARTSQLRVEQRSSRAKSQKERQLDFLFERLSPYRRIQVARYRAKDLLEPWQPNSLQ